MGLRVLALTAFFCTVALACIIWCESLMPSSYSAEQTAQISNSVKNAFNVDDSVYPQAIQAVKTSSQASPYYVGDVITFRIDYTPYNTTEKQLTVVNQSPNVADVTYLDGGVNVTFLARGTLNFYLYAAKSSVDDADISLFYSIICRGNNPDELSGDSLDFDIPNTFKLGDMHTVAVVMDGKKYYASASDLTVTGDAVKTATGDTILYAVAEGGFTLTYSRGDVYLSKTYTVKPNAAFAAPTALLTDDLNLAVGETRVMDVSAAPDGAFAYCFTSSSDTAVARVKGTTVAAVEEGSCTLTLVSVFDDTVIKTVDVTVSAVLPEGVKIVGKQNIEHDTSYVYTAVFDNSPTNGSVVWSVVSGQNKCSISKDGVLFSTGLGKVTIRATSVSDPSVYADLTVKVGFFSNLYTFTRKILGHFSLFAILGFGLLGVFLLLVKPRYYSPLFAAVTGFAVAGISEMFQLPVFSSGRYCSIIDVFLDFLGVLTGMCVAAIFVLIVCLIWRAVNRADFDNMRRGLKPLTFKTAFKKTAKLSCFADAPDVVSSPADSSDVPSVEPTEESAENDDSDNIAVSDGEERQSNSNSEK